MIRVIAILSIALAVALGGYYFLAPQGGTAGSDLLIGSANAEEAGDIDTSTVIEMQIGNPDAPVTMIEYASYTCSHCANFHNGPFKKIKANYIDTGKINFIYREVYFDKYGLWASMIARCGGPEKFFGITDLIYKGQRDWSTAGDPASIVAGLRKIALLAGVESDTLDACLQDGDTARTLVTWFQENAEADGINATPTFIINGEKVENQPYEGLADIIESKM